jgi:hypothetical protein
LQRIDLAAQLRDLALQRVDARVAALADEPGGKERVPQYSQDQYEDFHVAPRNRRIARTGPPEMLPKRTVFISCRADGYWQATIAARRISK